MYSRDPPLSNTVDSVSKCCIFIHYRLKIHDGNCLREWTFQNFKCIFLKIKFFNSTTSNAHNSAKNKARDLLLVSFCGEFYLVWPPGLNSKPTTWYLFIWTHTHGIDNSFFQNSWISAGGDHWWDKNCWRRNGKRFSKEWTNLCILFIFSRAQVLLESWTCLKEDMDCRKHDVAFW